MRPHVKMKPTAHVLLPLLLASATVGCYSFGHHERAPGVELQLVAIDEIQPRSDVRWSTFWGIEHNLWTPKRCSERNAQGACTQWITPCPDGVGRVDVSAVWYTAPMAIVTLGIAVPVRVTQYCAAPAAVWHEPPETP